MDPTTSNGVTLLLVVASYFDALHPPSVRPAPVPQHAHPALTSMGVHSHGGIRWDHAFNQAAINIEVADDSDDETGGVKINTKGETRQGLLSTRPPRKAAKAMFYGSFVKAASLTSINDGPEPVDRSKPMGEKELFDACGGLTAHKGARHGLKLGGKLARIEAADRELAARLSSGVDVVVAMKQANDALPRKRSASDTDGNGAGPAEIEGKKRKTQSDRKSKKQKKADDSSESDSDSDTVAAAVDSTESLKKTKKKKEKKKKDKEAKVALLDDKSSASSKQKKSKKAKKAEDVAAEPKAKKDKSKKKKKKGKGD